MLRSLLAMLLSVLLIPLPVRGENAARTKTLMIYMCGSNLESLYGSASADYMEIKGSGIDENVRVLIMMGGTAAWRMGLSSESTSIMEISRRGDRRVKAMEKMNMGDPETLSVFLSFCMDFAPADEYDLILWDHGGGPLDGLCWDEQYGADHLSLRELTQVLDNCGIAENKLGWIGFDACLMSSMEVGFALSPYADYMVSSQAEEPASGWNYAFLKGMGQDAAPADTGRRIVDAYFSAERDSARDLTLACVDLSCMLSLSDRLNSFFADLSGVLTVDTFADISRLRLNATGFGRAGEIEPGQNGYDLVDLVSLVESYASQSPDKAEKVVEGVRRAVVYQQSTLAQCCGLSVYHPWRNREKFRASWQNDYLALGFCQEYTRYVDYYGRIMSGEALISWSDLISISAVSSASGGSSRITAELTPEQAANVAGARLVILARNLYDAADESYSLVYRSQRAEQEGVWLRSDYDGLHLQAMDVSGFTSLTGALSYRVSEDGAFLLPIWPFDEEGNRAQTPLWAEYTLDAAGQLRLKDYLVFDEMTQTWSSRAETNLSQYRGITFRNEYRIPTANARGEILSFDQWTMDMHTDTHMKARYDELRTSFQLVFSRADLLRAESLYAAFEITDTQGYQYMTSLVPLEDSQAKEHPFVLQNDGNPGTPGEEPLSFSYRLFELPSSNPESARILLSASLRNTSDQDVTFLISDVRLNGVETDLAALSSQGTGSESAAGLRALAPGESGSASLIIRSRDIDALVPDVALRDILFQLYVGEGPAGGTNLKYVIPVAMKTEIPLTTFYWETDVLPPSWLVEYGKQTGALAESSEKALVSRDDLRISLRGVYICERNVVLLLHYENQSDHDYHFFLGRAKMDGQPASIGRSQDVSIVARNNRIATYHLDSELWDHPSGVYQIMHKGTSMDDYVVLKPDSEWQTSVKEISFQTYCYDLDNPLDATLFSDTVITSAEAAPLMPELLAVAPAEDYSVLPGQPTVSESGGSLMNEDIPAAPELSPRVLSVSDPDGDAIVDGFYVLLRRVSSDAELAGMNIMNLISVGEQEKSLSFSDGRCWLIYEAIGDLIPQTDGSAKGIFPGVLPVVRSGPDQMRLCPLHLLINEQGQFEFHQVANHLSFGSSSFPGAVLGTAVGSLSFGLDPGNGNVSLLEYKQTDGANLSLAETMNQRVYLISADADSRELAGFLNGGLSEDPNTLHQYQLMRNPKVSLSMELLPDPENYMVCFMYMIESSEIRCTLPVPLEEAGMMP